MKLSLQIYLDSDSKLTSIQYSYLLLESNRVYTRNEEDANFHIFYSLMSATANYGLNLDIATKYQVKLNH